MGPLSFIMHSFSDLPAWDNEVFNILASLRIFKIYEYIDVGVRYRISSFLADQPKAKDSCVRFYLNRKSFLAFLIGNKNICANCAS